MKNRFRWSCLVSLAVLAFAVPAEAGYPQVSYLSCYKNSDGSGGCYGSFAGARASSDPYAYAEFTDYAFSNASAHSRYFYGYLSGVSYSCQLTSSASAALVELWTEAMTTRGFFDVGWDATGTCNGIEVIAASQWYY